PQISRPSNHQQPTNTAPKQEPEMYAIPFTDTELIIDNDASALDWTRARCRDGNGTLTHLFFSDEPIATARAKAICAKCPLSAACLEGALERAEPWGVW